MAKVVELVVPDMHNNLKVYDSLDALVDKEVSKVFLVGDLKDVINYDSIKKLVEKVGPEKLKDESVFDSIFATESKSDYDKHEVAIKKIKDSKKVKFYGVPGNHDTVFIKDFVPSVDWLVYSQSLKGEKIYGAFGCREDVGELSEGFNGPGLRYVPFIDDDYTDLKKSEVYKNLKDAQIDLLVTHCGPNGASRQDIKYKGGLGVTELAKKKCVIYSGHDHKGIIYREKSGALIIRPGINYVAKVYRDGNDVSKVTMHKVM